MKLLIQEILQEVRPEFTFSNDENLIDDGFLDSFDIITLVTLLDEKFKISIEGLDITQENFKNINSIISLLKKYGIIDVS